MDAFSRAILSSAIFQRRDLACVLIALYAAVERFGAPKALITDNGSVFRAKQLLAICEALEIVREYIHPRQSWENLVETHFNVMRRSMAAQRREGTRHTGMLRGRKGIRYLRAVKMRLNGVSVARRNCDRPPAATISRSCRSGT